MIPTNFTGTRLGIICPVCPQIELVLLGVAIGIFIALMIHMIWRVRYDKSN